MKRMLLIGCFMLSSFSAFADKAPNPPPPSEPKPASCSLAPTEGNACALFFGGLLALLWWGRRRAQ
jgi:hypothetical protein